jgi:NAD(P)-dependent dehydrogenase (short-subunit alcohol dehydrogenase family)
MSQVSQARPHTARWTEADVPPQTGRIAVVTGANTGVGFQIARVLAARGATVVLACRDIAKAETAADRILDGAPQARVTATHLDLASLGSVRAAATALRDAYLRIDLLINNAGVMMTPYGRTADGFEHQLGVNHLGPFALTGLLLDRMLATEGSRVVTVSSFAHLRGRIGSGDLSARRGYRRVPPIAGPSWPTCCSPTSCSAGWPRPARRRRRWPPTLGTPAPNCPGTCRSRCGWAPGSWSRCSRRAPPWAACPFCARPPTRTRPAARTSARAAGPG